MPSKLIYIPFSIILYSFLVCAAGVAQTRANGMLDKVSGEGTVVIRQENDSTKAKQQALTDAINNALHERYGNSIVTSQILERNQSQLETFSRFVSLTHYFANGVWVRNEEDPKFSVCKQCYKLTESKRRKKALYLDNLVCKVQGYAKEIQNVPPSFSYKTLDGRGREVNEYQQGDTVYIEFKSSQSGYLTLYLDDTYNAARLLPYQQDDETDVYVKADVTYRFFDPKQHSLANNKEPNYIVLITDKPLDAFRIYFIFSKDRFDKNFSLTGDDLKHNVALPEGFERAKQIESFTFADWLQQNRILKDDLQIAIIDLTIKNKEWSESHSTN